MFEAALPWFSLALNSRKTLCATWLRKFVLIVEFQASAMRMRWWKSDLLRSYPFHLSWLSTDMRSEAKFNWNLFISGTVIEGNKTLKTFGFIFYNILFRFHISAHIPRLLLFHFQYFHCLMVIRRGPYLCEELQCQFQAGWYLTLCKKCSLIETRYKAVLTQVMGLYWQPVLLFSSRKKW